MQKLNVRLCSDLHLEFFYDAFYTTGEIAKQQLDIILPRQDGDDTSVLIVAGDLATARLPQRVSTFMKMVIPRFRHVIYVLGNHEHYGCRLTDSENLIRSALIADSVDMTRLTMVGNSVEKVNIDGATFYCTTFWTDYDRGNPATAMIVERFIRDHKAIILQDGTPFRVANAAQLHAELRKKLKDLLEQQEDHSRTVVVTHHMPTWMAIHEQYKRDEPARTLNAAFAANADDLISVFQPAFWVFGHTHTKFDDFLGDTRLICNPAGYSNEHNLAKNIYNPTLSFTV